MGSFYRNILRTGSVGLALSAILFLSVTVQAGNLLYVSGEPNHTTPNLTLLDGGGVKIPNQYIAVLRDDATVTDLQSASDHARGNGAEILQDYKYAIKGFAFKVPNDKVLDTIQKNDANKMIAFVEQDRVVNITGKLDETALISGQKLPTGIDRVDADQSSTKAGDGSGGAVDADIAIIDTGIDLTHPDLNVVHQVSFVRGASTANDDNGHGSHVAGIAAALDNSIGRVGMAPGARLWAVKVLDKSGAGSMSAVAKGVDYVTQHASEIDVVNMSLACSCNSGTLDKAIHNSVAAGVTYVVAAGNNHEDASNFSPANNPDVITVSAIADSDGKCGGLGSDTGYGADDSFASFSNYGSVVDMAAPGVHISSTYKGGSYASMSGTSMATPHVTGAAALYMSTHADASPSSVKASLINAGSTPATTCDGNGHGYFKGDPDGVSEPLLYARNY